MKFQALAAATLFAIGGSAFAQAPATTPAALVENATKPEQRVVVGTLSTLPDIARRENVKPPSLVIVGSVVSLHDKLSWFTRGVLAGLA